MRLCGALNLVLMWFFDRGSIGGVLLFVRILRGRLGVVLMWRVRWLGIGLRGCFTFII